MLACKNRKEEIRANTIAEQTCELLYEREPQQKEVKYDKEDKMITTDEVLSSEDININAIACAEIIVLGFPKLSTESEVIDEYKNVCSEMTRRFIHTFLEWDLCDKYVYHNEWNATYHKSDEMPLPVTYIIRADALQEVKAIVARRLSRTLKTRVHLKKWAGLLADELDEIYKVVDKLGSYHGSVKIRRNK